MSYVTLGQLIERYGERDLRQLTDPSDALESIDEVKTADAIAAIDALIDAHLADRYQLPLTAVPKLLLGIAQDLVWARLHVLGGSESAAAAEKEARRQLREIRDGALALPIPGVSTGAAAGGTVAFEAGERLFSRDSMRAW